MVEPVIGAEFQALTRRAQIHRVRQVALAALGDFDLPVERVRLVDHAFNTTFRVDTTDGRTFALRVNVHSQKDDAELDAELAWIAALARDTDISVPAPQPTRSGALRTSARFELTEASLPVVLMSWLPGPDLGDGTPASLRALGRLTARLHAHAERWTLPAGTRLASAADVLFGQPNRLAVDHRALTDAGREVFEQTHRVTQAAYDELTSASRPHPLHADLHGGNLKWYRRRLAVFDFDDSAIGVPAQDLGITAYYQGTAGELLDALLAGYVDERPLPAFTDDQFHALLAGRNLLLVNDVLGGAGAADRDVAPPYIRNTVKKLRHYLDTGEYRHDLPGLEPFDP